MAACKKQVVHLCKSKTGLCLLSPTAASPPSCQGGGQLLNAERVSDDDGDDSLVQVVL